MPTNEAGLVTAMAKAIRKKYPAAWLFKVVGSPFQMTGVPDLLIVVNGRLAGVEAKFLRPGETREHAETRVTPGQRFQIARIRKAGGVAGVAVTVEEAMALVDRAAGEETGRDDNEG